MKKKILSKRMKQRQILVTLKRLCQKQTELIKLQGVYYEREMKIRDLHILKTEHRLAHAMAIIMMWENSTEGERSVFEIDTPIQDFLSVLPFNFIVDNSEIQKYFGSM